MLLNAIVTSISSNVFCSTICYANKGINIFMNIYDSRLCHGVRLNFVFWKGEAVISSSSIVCRDQGLRFKTSKQYVPYRAAPISAFAL